MLAKVWKKVLLAICIIACIYNIMSKLVNRASLEANLQKANDGNTIFDFSSKDSKSNTSEIVDGVISRNVTIENTIENEISEDETTSTSNENIQNEVIEEEAEDEEVQEETKSQGVKFTDLIFKW